MADLHHRVITRVQTVHVVVGKDPNYPASCAVFKYGDRGMIWQINGRRFYEHFSRPGTVSQLCDELGVGRLEGYMTFAHERAVARYLRESATVERDGVGVMDGKEMPWVIVKPR